VTAEPGAYTPEDFLEATSSGPTIEERLAALEVLGTAPVRLEPGETLIIRTTDLTPNQIREYQQALDYEHECGHFPFQSVVVHGDELAAARPKAEGE
jgi:hypothetical protein